MVEVRPAAAGARGSYRRGADRWRGTLFLIGQPGEEGGAGASKMLKDGLFTRFPKPDFAISLHDKASEPAGKVVVTPGWVFANAMSSFRLFALTDGCATSTFGEVASSVTGS